MITQKKEALTGVKHLEANFWCGTQCLLYWVVSARLL